MNHRHLLVALLLPLSVQARSLVPAASLEPAANLRVEYLNGSPSIDVAAPRFSWELARASIIGSPSFPRGLTQIAYQIQVATTPEKLLSDQPDLWDSGRIDSSATNQIPYTGKPLPTGAQLHWRVRTWLSSDPLASHLSPLASFSTALAPADWRADWISVPDTTPLHTDPKKLDLPPAHHFRREFTLPASKPIRRATLYASALGLYDAHCNGQRIGDAYFQPGWADYAQRAYYRAHDLTAVLRAGSPNALAFTVAEGWYAGYVGFGLLVGQGPNKTGKNFYGKTPALLAQLEIEYVDGTRETIATDAKNWLATTDGPTREADLIMGETYDARLELPGWDQPNFKPSSAWSPALPAEKNPAHTAIFHDAMGERDVTLKFTAPPRLQTYSAPPIRVTQELPALRISEPAPGVYIFDLGQNFAGIALLKTKGPAGTSIRLRFGEMLHKDGRLMTENLRKARATDTYILRGDPAGETWSPRFTYHGFRYVEVTGFTEKPTLETITGLVLHNDTPPAGTFECSDEVLTQFAKNSDWTRRANFVEMPTDCPQRDERLGWTGDAQAYIRTATYQADTAAFYTKWLDDLVEAQRPWGTYTDYAPYPMAHGARKGKTAGTGWADAGIICPWTLWQVYGDRALLEKNWASMTRFMDWRQATTHADYIGSSVGNPWGDWLNVNEPTPIEFIDTCYHALCCTLMAEMADTLGKTTEARNYRARLKRTADAFAKTFVKENGTLTVDTQTAYVLALWTNLVPEKHRATAAQTLADKIAANGHRMTTGFLGTRALLPALTANGQHDLAVRLFQNRVFPSWGYEVVNGATSVWERWDSFTTEHGFDGLKGDQNASMNSFSHYAFGAVMEWAYRSLAGIDTAAPGYRHILIAPQPPSLNSNPDNKPIDWVKASYRSINGVIATHWKNTATRFELAVTIPPNTTATIILPQATAEKTTESGQPLNAVSHLTQITQKEKNLHLTAASGTYHFQVQK